MIDVEQAAELLDVDPKFFQLFGANDRAGVVGRGRPARTVAHLRHAQVALSVRQGRELPLSGDPHGAPLREARWHERPE